MTTITDAHALRALYKPPTERVIKKQLDHLDRHCRTFIGHVRFVVLSSMNRRGQLDSSPRGGEPGFVKVIDDRSMVIPDRPGNNRLDTMTNIVETGRIAILMMIPGIEEMLRVNGFAELRDDEELRALCVEHERKPPVVLKIGVEEAYLHCAKAVMRSGLWLASAQIPRSSLPTMGQMQRDQTGLVEALESPEAALARHRSLLY